MAEVKEAAKESKEVSAAEELAKVKEAYETLATAFNKLLQEYNEMHVAMLLKK